MNQGRDPQHRDHGVPIRPEEILDERLGALYQVINEMQCGILVQRKDGTVLGSNERLRRWLGCDDGPEGLLDTAVLDLIASEMRESFAEHARRIEKGDLRAYVTVLRRTDGTTFPVLSIPQRFTRAGWEDVLCAYTLVDLATIQTAQGAGDGEGEPADVCSTLDRIATELRAISLSLSTQSRTPLPLAHPVLAALTEREREVLIQLDAGHRVPAIAKALYISPNTVRNHLKSMYRKLRVHSQTELLERVRSLGKTGGER